MGSTILVVDDEEMTRKLLRLMLERDGFNIVEAEDGLLALEAVHRYQPDVVILDVMMPNLDGFATCKQIRQQPETANLPVILLSARSQQDAYNEGARAGANCYMTKPISRPTLIQTINDLLMAHPSL